MAAAKLTADHVAIVTGASSGIGEELAQQLARRGFKLVLAARGAQQLTQVAERCLSLGAADVAVKPTDVSQEKQCKALVDFAVKKYERLDLLVLNAGVACHQRFEETDLSVFHSLMAVNYFGYVYCTKYALPHLRHSRGAIAAIGSVSGELGFPLRTAYCASKFAVTGFFESLQAEIGNEVQITLVQPAFVNTPIRDHALGPKGSDIEHNETKRMSVEECVTAVLDAVARRQQKRILTTSARAAVIFKPLLPRTVQYLANRKTNAKIAAKL